MCAQKHPEKLGPPPPPPPHTVIGRSRTTYTERSRRNMGKEREPNSHPHHLLFLSTIGPFLKSISPIKLFSLFASHGRLWAGAPLREIDSPTLSLFSIPTCFRSEPFLPLCSTNTSRCQVIFWKAPFPGHQPFFAANPLFFPPPPPPPPGSSGGVTGLFLLRHHHHEERLEREGRVLFRISLYQPFSSARSGWPLKLRTKIGLRGRR